MSLQSALALKLNGNEYLAEAADHQVQYALENDLVIVTGGSDDLCYFQGAYAEEHSAYDGNIYYWDKKNEQFVPINDEDADVDDPKYWIKQVWCAEGCDYGWTFTTNIPNTAKFIVAEGDEIYGEGLVINLNSMEK
jgi:hypothetical protein